MKLRSKTEKALHDLGYRYSALMNLWFHDRLERCIEVTPEGRLIHVDYHQYQEPGTAAPEPLSSPAAQPE